MAASLAIGLRTAFMVLGCLITATVIYTIATDGLPFRKELLTPWMAATLVDFYINVLAIGVWIVYKESNWICSVIWIILLICLGSITTCLYIVMQFLKLSPQESIQDPIYFVLLRKRNKDEMESKRMLSVVNARLLFGVLACLMLGTLIYTIATDGSPFRRENLNPIHAGVASVCSILLSTGTYSISLRGYRVNRWMSATLIDFYINVVALSVWVAYKESNWRTAAFWIILLICFGSLTTCTYIVLQLFHLSSQDPVFLVLLSSSNRAVNGYEGTSQTEKCTAGR